MTRLDLCRTRGCPNAVCDDRTVDGRPVEPGYTDGCAACIRRWRADRAARLDGRHRRQYGLPGEGNRR